MLGEVYREPAPLEANQQFELTREKAGGSTIRLPNEPVKLIDRAV